MPELVNEEGVASAPRTSRRARCEEVVKFYLLVKGAEAEDRARETLRRELRAAMKRLGGTSVKDGDAGLLPSQLHSRSNELNPGACVPLLFIAGKLPSGANVRDIQAEVSDAVEHHASTTKRRASYVLLVASSPVHRATHDRQHACVPSRMFDEYSDVVLVEACNIDARAMTIVPSLNREGRGLISVHKAPHREPPVRPGHAKPDDWLDSDDMKRLPDGKAGVGGKGLVFTMGLERSGFRGGDIPDIVKVVTPEQLDLVEITDARALPRMVLANKVRVVEAVGASGPEGYLVNMKLENATDRPEHVKIPQGSLFEVVDPKAGVQNLAVGRDYDFTLQPHETRFVELNAYCANHGFRSPCGDQMRPTVFRMGDPGRSQADTWAKMDSKGFD